jgi:hypothetical protein
MHKPCLGNPDSMGTHASQDIGPLLRTPRNEGNSRLSLRGIIGTYIDMLKALTTQELFRETSALLHSLLIRITRSSAGIDKNFVDCPNNYCHSY